VNVFAEYDNVRARHGLLAVEATQQRVSGWTSGASFRGEELDQHRDGWRFDGGRSRRRHRTQQKRGDTLSTRHCAFFFGSMSRTSAALVRPACALTIFAVKHDPVAIDQKR
jgi:hypothetical protein